MKELGIRVSLDARMKHVLAEAVGRPIALLGAGSIIGMVWAIFAIRLLGKIVYQANPTDPLIMLGAVLIMALLGIAASAILGMRAVRVDPSKLLREE